MWRIIGLVYALRLYGTLPDFIGSDSVTQTDSNQHSLDSRTLQVRSLYCSRSYRRLVDDFCVSLEAGAGLQVTGVNGVGKTTLLKSLATLSRPDSGSIHWCGQDIREDIDSYRSDLSYLGHKLGLAPQLTPSENLAFFRRFLPGSENVSIDLGAALEAMGCDEYAHVPVSQLSAGQKQRVALSRVCMGASWLWILDEPANALDNDGIALLKTQLSQHLDRGGLLIFTSHLDLGINRCSPVALHPIPTEQ